MKKIFIAIAMMLAGMAANAQMSDDFKTFTLGEFVFKNLTPYSGAEKGGGLFIYSACDDDTARELVMFMRLHKDEIEKKYGVELRGISNTESFKDKTGKRVPYEVSRATVEIFDANALDRYNKRREAEEKKRKQERARKMSELEKIISE